MSPEDTRQKALEYAGHLADCDTECGWDCDCGWEKIESKMAKEKEMLNDEFELDPEARATLERWEQVSAKMTEDMKDHIKGLISDLETTLKFGNGRIWLGLNANVMLAHSIYGVDRFAGTPDFSKTGWIEAKGRRGAVEHTRRKRSQQNEMCHDSACMKRHGAPHSHPDGFGAHHEMCSDPMGCHPDCKMREVGLSGGHSAEGFREYAMRNSNHDQEGGEGCSHPDCYSPALKARRDRKTA